MIFIIIILLGLCVFLKPRNEILQALHFVEVDCFQTYEQALNFSQKVSNSGGAGYIYFDTTYHVFASFHNSEKDAKQVVENIKSTHKNATVFSLSISRFTSKKNLSNTQNNVVKTFVEESGNLLLKLENYSTKFFKNEISSQELTIQISQLEKDFESCYSDLITAFKKNSKFNIAKDYAHKMFQSITNFKNSTERNDSFLRYEIINFAIYHCQFLSCF